jgi:benzoyl-CoA reductase/2-hydroxyglutaryl-CoA dehydratase subunit BcrC/BadD/HgdB
MSEEYIEIWKNLGLDMDRHSQLLDALRTFYPKIYKLQRNRPEGMKYFDYVISEIHGLRLKELLEHKEKGGKVVGTFCLYVPEELILASGAKSVGLCGGSRFSIPDAEVILPRNLCPLIKSSVGFKLGRICPYFEACDFLVGETTCDGKKKVWEILNEYVPIHVMELPHKKDSKEDRELWLHEIIKFKTRLEGETKTNIKEEKLKEAIKEVNNKRKALKRLYGLRRNRPSPISGKDALLVSQLAFYDDCNRFTLKVNELCDELEERVRGGTGVTDGDAPRIIISGCPMAIPNWKLHNLIETGGGVVVCEESCTGTRYFMEIVNESGENLDSYLKNIAERYLKINCACFTPNEKRIDQIVEFVRDYKADGVIHYTLQFCQPYNIESFLVEKSLKEEGIPILRLESDYSEEDISQINIRVEAFLERITPKGGK